MLFNSYEFLFGFLPVVLLLYFLIERSGRLLTAMGWLALASLCFYGWWNPAYLLLLCGSIVVNFGFGRLLAASSKRTTLGVGITCNLALLGYFKYAGFFAVNTNQWFGLSLPILDVALPLGISFFTFTQIAYLVDVYRREAHDYGFTQYVLFVSFFPHLLAGPVLHHAEIMPQFTGPAGSRLTAENFAIGITIFAIGLFKKVILADGIAEFASPVFDAAQGGAKPGMLAAWAGVLCYTFQLYFDFSGYSDMAIGLARMFGVVFPANFNSPYKATSMIEFWRRWHMTLSRFLRDYLYVPLGGNRHGTLRRYANLMTTMVLGGLWHGAGWTFVIWGALHGAFLVVNHIWRTLCGHLPEGFTPPAALSRWAGRLLTFLCVVIAWVFFRADSVSAASAIIEGMAGINGLGKGDPHYFGAPQLKGLLVLFIIVWCLPNAQQLLARYQPVLETYRNSASTIGPRLAWRPSAAWALFTAALCIYAVTNLTRVSEFLYYRF